MSAKPGVITNIEKRQKFWPFWVDMNHNHHISPGWFLQGKKKNLHLRSVILVNVRCPVRENSTRTAAVRGNARKSMMRATFCQSDQERNAGWRPEGGFYTKAPRRRNRTSILFDAANGHQGKRQNAAGDPSVGEQIRRRSSHVDWAAKGARSAGRPKLLSQRTLKTYSPVPEPLLAGFVITFEVHQR